MRATGPKVIASTATIRRAGHQTQGSVRPRDATVSAPGTRRSRLVFRRRGDRRNERDRDSTSGLMAPGTSHTTLMVRAYARCFSRRSILDGQRTTSRTPTGPCVGYFNSLRVLGGARMQVQDDVSDRIELIAGTTSCAPRDPDRGSRLTSREASEQHPEPSRTDGSRACPDDDATRRHPRDEHDLGGCGHRPARD